MAYLNLGDFYYENRQIENTIAACSKVLELQEKGPVRAKAMDILINAYDDYGIRDRAVALEREYLRLYPNDPNVLDRRIRIGIFLYNLKEYDRAISSLREVKPLVSADDEPRVQYWIAKCYADDGNREQAIIEFLKVKYLSKPTKLPYGPTALYEAALEFRKLKNYSKAIELMRQVVTERGLGDSIGQAANMKIQEIEDEMKSGQK
jgi:tetratricopeptide (TPR) repeat protein